jgi:DNA processing protein
VGTRRATENRKQLCKQLVEELQQYNVLIVSGLALEIDAYAHKECLKQGLQTIGVLGHSFDTMYPAQNRSLAEKMQ